MPKGITHSLIERCKLVRCTGRYIQEDKAGYINHHNSHNLEQLGITMYINYR